MERVNLEPKTKKGREKIKKYGSTWHVLKKLDKVLFDQKNGPWLLVSPVPEHSDATRWIHSTDDSNFNVENL